jgi:hypothetical protein
MGETPDSVTQPFILGVKALPFPWFFFVVFVFFVVDYSVACPINQGGAKAPPP